jgi:release factor glutamine methyltransferase
MQREEQWVLKEKYLGQPNKNFYKDIERLKAGEPVDYVIGFTEFLNCKIDLSKKPLIPRVETEYWVEKAIEEIKNCKIKNIKCLDIFSGSGCVGVAILKNTQVLLCDFADSEPDCITQIKINLKINNIDKKRYKVIQSDISKNVKNKYDFIFANPPYIPKTRKNKLDKSVINFEPSKALFGGTDGLFYIKKFLKDAKKYLNINGKIYIEFDCTQKKEIEKLIKKFKYSKYIFNKDQYNKWRWVIIEKTVEN